MDHQQKRIQFIGKKQSLYKSDPIKYDLNSILLKKTLTIDRYTILEWSNYKCNGTNKCLNIPVYNTCNNSVDPDLVDITRYNKLGNRNVLYVKDTINKYMLLQV
jgi:hypothetical protein